MPCGRKVGRSLAEWTARSMSSRIQRAVEFLGEKPLAARLGEGAILNEVAARLDDDDFQLRRLRRHAPPRAFASLVRPAPAPEGCRACQFSIAPGGRLPQENRELPISLYFGVDVKAWWRLLHQKSALASLGALAETRSILSLCGRAAAPAVFPKPLRSFMRFLGIETTCDETAAAVVEARSPRAAAKSSPMQC